MIASASSFIDRWIWPAGGSGGIPGDVVATLIWVIIAGISASVIWPPSRKRIEAFFQRHFAEGNAELHRKLDHIIKYHPDIPDLPPKDDHLS
jgi:hypothetical protein